MSEPFRIRRALLSVTDKSHLETLGAALRARDVELVASGGTASTLENAGLAVTAVDSITGFPEMLGGRVKTLHPNLHAGLLADRGNASHRSDLQTHGITPIELVVVNFYAFEKAAAEQELPIEAIDIGGPTLVRAAAKNHQWVVVLTDPSDYDEFLQAWEQDALDLSLRRRFAARSFERVAHYDRAIANVFATASGEQPTHRVPLLRPFTALRYGENPHQQGEALQEVPAWGLARLEQLAGTELSYNNLVDADSTLDLVLDLDQEPACVITKHNNPCGVAHGDNLLQAWEKALSCDPVSAFGGVVAVNQEVDAEVAEAMAGLFLEVIAAPGFSKQARERLQKKKRLRLLTVPADTWKAPQAARTERNLHGLVLVQDRDTGFPELAGLEVVTTRQPTPEELRDADFLWRVAKHVRSNAIVIGRNRQTLGIGAGQMSRVDSSMIAARKAADAGLDLKGSIAASDAFFPFADGVEQLAGAGVTVVVQPGGSKRDPEVIEAANRLNLCMLFTGRRHFRH
jgi:phosphoribosylaminoimidazolecarboxamide formyltransferase/IMP cyclohydrolase